MVVFGRGEATLILNDIKEKLKEVDPNVFYGMVNPKMRETIWDYIVFERKTMSKNANKTGFSNYFTVHIVREEFIPEGLEITVINKLLEIPGMRLTDQDGTYTYVPKPNTDVVVEMFSIDFVKPMKV